MRLFLNPRRVVNGATMLLAVLVLVLSGHDAWEAYRKGLGVQQTGRYFTLSSQLVEASALQARERGLTALLLGLGGADVQLREVRQLRRDGDRIWQQAMAQVRRLLQNLPQQSNLVRLQDLALTAYQSLLKGRQLADRSIGNPEAPLINGRQWLERSTGFIRASDRLRRALAARVEIPPGDIRTILDLTDALWMASESVSSTPLTLPPKRIV